MMASVDDVDAPPEPELLASAHRGAAMTSISRA